MLNTKEANQRILDDLDKANDMLGTVADYLDIEKFFESPKHREIRTLLEEARVTLLELECSELDKLPKLDRFTLRRIKQSLPYRG